MATMLGSLLVSLGLESGEFKSGLASAEKELQRSTRRMEKIGENMQDLGKRMALAVTLPLTALGVASFKAASDVAELESAFDVTFGNMATSVRKWAEETGDAMGRSTQEMMGMAVSFQDILKQQMDPAAAAELSKELTVLTQDLASFKNLSNDVAKQKIFSGLIGEAEPLRAVGVLLSATAVDAKALELGLASSKKEISEGAKVQARAALIMEQLSDAQGDVIRTADSTANQIKTARAAFDELRVAIGTKLIPAITPLIGHLTDLLNGFNRLSPGVQTAIVYIGAFAAGLGPLLFAFGTLTTFFAPMIAGIKAIGGVAVATAAHTGSLAAGLTVLRVAVVSLIGSLAPYIVALGVVASVVAALIIRHRQLTQASETYRKAQDAATKAAEKGSAAASQLAMAQGEARKAALLAARQEQRNIAVKLRSAQASLALAKAELITARARADAINQSAAVGDTSGILFGSDQAAKASANLKAQAATVRTYANALREVTAALRQPEIAVSDVAAVATDEKKKGRSGPTGPTAAEIEARFNDELIGYTQQSLSAMQRLAKNADERAELELRSVEWARRQTLAHIAADEDYTAAQKAELSAAVERLAGYEREGIELQRQIDLEREAADLAQIAFDSQREQLALAGDVADTQAERKRIALDILALEQEYRRNQLEMVLASEVASDAEKARAQAILDSLAAIEAGERTSVGRRNETEVEAYLRSLNRSPEQMNEAVSGAYIDGLDALTNGLANALSKVQSLGDAFKSMRDVAQEAIQQVIADLIRLGIQQTINKFLAQAIFGGGGGSPIDLLAGTPYGGARAAGGPIRSGMAYLVGEKGPEVVVPGRSGTVIANKDLQGMSGGATNNFNISVTGPMSDREARRTGNQIASAAQQRMAQARRSGIAG